MTAVTEAPHPEPPVRTARLGRTLIEKTIGNVGLNIAALVLNFAIALFLSRTLGSSGYGAFAFAIAFANLLAVPGQLGLPSLVVREIASYRVHSAWESIRGVIRRANQAAIVASVGVVVAAAAVIAAAGWPHGILRTPTLLALCLVPLTAITSMRQSVMQGFLRVVLGRAPETVFSPLLLLGLLVVLRAGHRGSFDPRWAVAAAVVAAACATVLGIILLRRILPNAVRTAAPAYATRRWAVGAVPLLLVGGISTLNDQTGSVLLGALGTAHEVGVYSVANRVANVTPFLLIAAIPTLMPWISELHTRGESERLQRLMTRASRIVFVGSLPLAIAVFAAAGPLLRVFGADFPGGATPLRILVAGQIVNIVTGFPGTILVMSHAAGRVTLAVAAAAVTNLALNVALDPGLGATGAAVAGATSIAVANTLLSVALWRSRRIWAPAIWMPR
jgi:O-antigen/teichoic acid export membrane protein